MESDFSLFESFSLRVLLKCISEKKFKFGNFKEFIVKRKIIKLGEKVKNVDKNNKGARFVNGGIVKLFIVVL